MNLSRKLTLVLALGLLGAALTAPSALGGGMTTLSPTGNYSLSAGTTSLNAGFSTVTCTSSSISATMTTDGTGTITSMAFAGCTAFFGTVTCVVTFSDSSSPATITWTAGDNGTFSLGNTPSGGSGSTSGDLMKGRVSCDGGQTCTYAGRSDITGVATGDNGTDPASVSVSGQPFNLTTPAAGDPPNDAACAATPLWTATYTIDTPNNVVLTS
jgi:hypothetical protein